MKPLSQLMFSAFVVVVVFLVVLFIAAIVAIPLFGFQQVSGMVNGFNINDPATIRMLKYFQVVQSAGLFILPAFLIAFLFDERPLEYLSLTRKISLSTALLVIFLVVVVNPFVNFTGTINAEVNFPEWMAPLEEWMRNAEEAAASLTEAFLKTDSLAALSFNLFMIAVLPALGEELLFRGVIQKQLGELTRSTHWGIWLSAGLFSALHMQFMGFIPRMLLGGLFGYLLAWSGSLWLPIFAHFVNNAGAVIALWLIDNGKIDSSFEDFGAGTEHWHYALASLVLTGFTLVAIRQAIPGIPGPREEMAASTPGESSPGEKLTEKE